MQSRAPADQRVRGRARPGGRAILKCVLHISPEEQEVTLAGPTGQAGEHWKFNPADVDERRKWRPTARPTRLALERQHRDRPWHVILRPTSGTATQAIDSCSWTTVRGMASQWPEADFDVAEQKQRLLGEDLVGDPHGLGHPLRHPPARGGTLPGIVEADDLGTYVCKFRGAGQGRRGAGRRGGRGELARRIGLSLPELVGLDLDPEVARLRGRRGGPGPPSAPVPASTSGWTSCPERSATTAPFTTARRGREGPVARRLHRQRRPELAQPQPAGLARRLWVIDHGAALYFHHGWSAVSPTRRGSHTPLTSPTTVLGGYAARPGGRRRRDLTACSDEPVFAEVLAGVPDHGWSQVPGADTPDAGAPGLRDRSWSRRLSTPQWLPERRRRYRLAKAPGSPTSTSCCAACRGWTERSSSTSGWCSTARPPTSSTSAGASTRTGCAPSTRASTSTPVCEALSFVAGVCAGDARGGAAAEQPIGTRFGFLMAPRSTVLQPGPVHGGVTPTRPASSTGRSSTRPVG